MDKELNALVIVVTAAARADVNELYAVCIADVTKDAIDPTMPCSALEICVITEFKEFHRFVNDVAAQVDMLVIHVDNEL